MVLPNGLLVAADVPAVAALLVAWLGAAPNVKPEKPPVPPDGAAVKAAGAAGVAPEFTGGAAL